MATRVARSRPTTARAGVAACAIAVACAASLAASLAIGLAACGAPPEQLGADAGVVECVHTPRPARSLRVFAVGHQVTVDEAASLDAYRAAVRATVQETVVDNLSPDRPNLLVFPESMALSALLLGTRGEAARAQATVLEAFGALAVDTVAPANVYADIAEGEMGGRLIALAMTDSVWRAYFQVFSEIASEFNVFVVTSADVGDVAELGDPDLAAILGDPDRPPGSPVYWVPDGRVYNQAHFFAPDGQVFAAIRKHYLTDPEIDLLDLSGGLPEVLGPVDIGGEISAAVMISRDAWMQDALERAALRGAEVLLQPEAFIGGWGLAAPDEVWIPDNLKRSGWAAVQKYPELRYAFAPMLVGNFFDLVFDGQSFIADKGVPGGVERALVGQEPGVGWAAIAPWVADDPAVGTLDERRDALRAEAQALLVGGARENQYRSGTVFVDVDIPVDDGYPAAPDATPGAEVPALGASAAIAPSGLGRQRTADLIATETGAVIAVWDDSRLCTSQIWAARAEDGRTFAAPTRIQPWNRPQRTPRIVQTADGAVAVAWQEQLGPDRAEIRVARSADGVIWQRPVRVDADATVEAWTPALARDTETGALYLAFVDARPEPDGTVNRRVYVSRSTDHGRSWSAAVRVDPRPRQGRDATFANEWSPAIAARGGRVVVTYTHRQRPRPDEQPSHDVFVATSDDGGDSFGAPIGVDAGGSPERLAADLAVDLGPDGWRVLYSSLRGLGADADVAVASEGRTQLGFAPDIEGGPRRDQWFPAVARLAGGDRVVVWQDARNGGADVYMARLTEAGFGPALRVDDAGSAPAHAWRPRVAIGPGDVVFAIWEDSRSGHGEIRIARGVPPPGPAAGRR